jgi:hypothetical protein
MLIDLDKSGHVVLRVLSPFRMDNRVVVTSVASVGLPVEIPARVRPAPRAPFDGGTANTRRFSTVYLDVLRFPWPSRTAMRRPSLAVDFQSHPVQTAASVSFESHDSFWRGLCFHRCVYVTASHVCRQWTLATMQAHLPNRPSTASRRIRSMR